MSEGKSEAVGQEGCPAAATAEVREVIFVCTSNTCRSPMAEGVARQWFAEALGVPEAELKGKGWHIRSGGLSHDWEPEDSPVSTHR